MALAVTSETPEPEGSIKGLTAKLEQHRLTAHQAPTGREESLMVLKDVGPAIDKLARDAQRLNELSDQFQRELITLEERLQAANIGVEASFPSRDSDAGRDSFLHFGKDTDRWRILLFTRSAAGGGMSYKPLVNASREERLAAAPYVQGLVRAIAQAVTAASRRLELAIDGPPAQQAAVPNDGSLRGENPKAPGPRR